ncbi:OmpA family protein [Pyxidicoccus xibeiensis]|uniref:OmpA family protein n=1 Tax=Pyxidicoccus xibeiensis TaxID=2906759 RepID=UPI0020A835E1|nr:OmpA family protein [Pyxidicoccus xibeiensis]MCP3141159.1 OmpA family protein [Pyxidicoccus xibeiensis]
MSGGSGSRRGQSMMRPMLLACLLVLTAPLAASAQPVSGGGALLELRHEDRLGADGSWELRSVEYVLDGTRLATPADGARHPLPVGLRQLDVRVVYEGRSQVFSYVEGYRFVMRGRVTLDARPGDTVRVTSTAYVREGVTQQWQHRPAFLLSGQPREAVVGIEYGPVENTPLAEAAASRAVDEVLAEARRLTSTPTAEARGSCVLEPVFFRFSDTRLSPEAEAVLQRAAVCLIQQPGLAVRLQGHADASGPESVNTSLGQGRAQSVAAYLLSLGVERARLVLGSEGDARPPCPEHTPACFARSRRVELVAEPSGP